MNREEDIREWVEYAEADRLSAQNAFNAADYRDVAFHPPLSDWNTDRLYQRNC